MDYVARIHLKTNTNFRQEMVDYCLNNSEQYHCYWMEWID